MMKQTIKIHTLNTLMNKPMLSASKLIFGTKDCCGSTVGRKTTVSTTLLSIALAVLPKCPVCLAAYLSVFAAVSISADALEHFRMGLSVIFGIFMVYLFWQTWKSKNICPAIIASIALVIALPDECRLYAVATVGLFITLFAVFGKQHRVQECCAALDGVKMVRS